MDPLSRAVELLPTWVPRGGPALFLALAVPGALGWFSLWGRLFLRPLRLEEARAAAAGESLHWTARARLSFAARRGLLVLALGYICCAVPMALFWIGPLAQASAWWLLPLVGLLTTLSAVEVYRRRMLPPALGRRPALAEVLSGLSVVVLLQPVLLLVVALLLAPARLFSWQTAIWALLTSLGILAGHYGVTLRLLVWLRLARPAPAGLLAIVERTASPGPQPRGVYVLRWGVLNALALPLAGLLAFSEGMLDALTEEEIAAITAHELGHLSEPPGVLRLRLATGLLLLLLGITPTLVRDYGPIAGLGGLLTFLLCSVGVRRLLRRMEERADAHAQLSQPSVYASALEKLYRLNGMPAAVAGSGVHPALYDRLIAAGTQPEYARPAPPPRAPARLAVLGVVLVAFGWLVLTVLARSPHLFTSDYELASAWRLSVTSADGSVELGNIAAVRMYASHAEADVFFDAAEQVSVDKSRTRGWRVFHLASAGRCQEATKHLSKAAADLGVEALSRDEWLDASAAIGECEAAARSEQPGDLR